MMETYHLIALMIMPLIIVAVIFDSPQAAPIKGTFFKSPAAEADPPPSKEICTKTTLYSLTSRPQKENTILCHPDVKTMQRESQDNILFNQGLVAGQHSSLIKCPSSNKNICSGWDYAKKYL